MALSEKQRAWVAKIGKVRDESIEYADSTKNKTAIVNEIASDLNNVKDDVHAAAVYELEPENASIFNRLLRRSEALLSIDPNHDPNKEIDTWADLPKTKSLPPEKIQKIMAGHTKLVNFSEKMREKLAKETKKDGSPRYDDAQINEIIKDEIWTPLVREGVIPENQVPDKYSKVKEVFSSSAKLYEERLTKFTENLEANHGILDKLGKGKVVAKHVGDIGSNVVGAVASVKPSGGVDAAKTAVDLFNVTMSGSLTIAESTVKKSADDAVSTLGTMVKEFTKAIGGKDLANVVGSAYTAITNSPKIGYKLVTGDIDGALNSLADSVESAFAVLDNGKSDGGYEKIGKMIAAGIKGAKGSAKLAKAAVEGDKTGMQSAFKEILSAAFSLAKDPVKKTLGLDGDESDEDEDEGDDPGAALMSAAQGLANLESNEERQALKERLETLSQKRDTEELEQGNLDFQNLLANGFAMPNDDAEENAQALRRQADAIDGLILQMQKDRLILDGVDKLVSGGLDIAGKFLPAFGVVAHAKEFAKRVVAAALRAQQLNEWMESLGDSLSASSVYAEAIKRRVKDSKVQLSKETIKAVLAMAQTIGAAAACTGLDAGVGTAIEKSAAAASATADLVYYVYNEADLAKQWKIYKEAMRTPQNRKLARQSLRGNPTLAKYALAYGGIIDRDAMAMNAISKCGLTDKVLTNPESNCHKVVLYLETYFADDPVLERALIDPQKWYPGKPELSLASWVSFLAAGKTSAEPPIKVKGNSAVDGALGLLDAARKKYATDKNRGSLTKALENVVTACSIYRPETDDGSYHKSFGDYVDSLKAMAQLEIRDLAALPEEKGSL